MSTTTTRSKGLWRWHQTTDAFLDKVSPEPNTGCWLWTASSRNDQGYGSFRNGLKNVPAHRYSWELENGPIPEGFVLDHLCRVPCCVNPRHLRVVTQRENTLAMGSRAPAKQNAVKTHCPMGHEYTAENTNIYKGHRKCRACHRKRERLRLKSLKGIEL